MGRALFGDTCTVVCLLYYLLAFCCRHLLWVGNDANTPEVKAVGIKACVDGRISRLVSGGMESASLFEQFYLSVGQRFQTGLPEGVYPLGRPWSVENVVAIAYPAGVVEVGEQCHDKRVYLGCQQLFPVGIDPVPVTDAMNVTVCPSGKDEFAYLSDYFLHCFEKVLNGGLRKTILQFFSSKRFAAGGNMIHPHDLFV